LRAFAADTDRGIGVGDVRAGGALVAQVRERALEQARPERRKPRELRSGVVRSRGWWCIPTPITGLAKQLPRGWATFTPDITE
jgi:hypothetical protein